MIAGIISRFDDGRFESKRGRKVNILGIVEVVCTGCFVTVENVILMDNGESGERIE